ncbi:hypothetical protein QP162_00955 [Sphingomonas aurantiaca]|uniref:hypothetical protein n=1 Tax=Sphingomonas aurantiaca TaxID=185949 RepID=UPI002FE0D64A
MSTAHTMFAAILALCALTGAATPARERVIEGNGIVDSTIAGAAGRIRIEPSGTGMPLITTAFAERATLKSGMLSFSYAVGTERVHGRTGLGRSTSAPARPSIASAGLRSPTRPLPMAW